MKSSPVPIRWPGRPASTAPAAAGSPSPFAPRPFVAVAGPLAGGVPAVTSSPFVPKSLPSAPVVGSPHGAPIQAATTKPSVKKKDKSTEGRLKRVRERDRHRFIGKPVFKKKKLSGYRYRGGRTGGHLAISGLEAARSLKESPGKSGFTTPLGPVNLSTFPTKDPGAKITTLKKVYGASVGHKYTDLVDALGSKSKKQDKKIAAELLRVSMVKKSKPVYLKSAAQRNAAAKLLAIANISERQRVGGSGKAFRGVLRMVKAGEISLKEAFTGHNPTFPMAKSPDYMRRVVNYDGKKFRKKTTRPKRFDKLAGYMSDSSDEDD